MKGASSLFKAGKPGLSERTVAAEPSGTPQRRVIDIAENYNRYYSSHLYLQRYPCPNPMSFGIIAHEIAKRGNRVLDFGCGNGRYTAPLLERTDARVIAYDISQVALDELSLRCNRHIRSGRLQPVTGELPALSKAAGSGSRFDVAIMMFGVLGHIPSHGLRQETLALIRSLLRPGGSLIVTVPNAARRFRKEQNAARRLIEQGRLEPGDILYQRRADDVTVELFYHLYTQEGFRRQVEEGGFHLRHLGAESFLPESLVVKSSPLRRIDRIAAALLPLAHAYGFLAVAEAPVPPDEVVKPRNLRDNETLEQPRS